MPLKMAKVQPEKSEAGIGHEKTKRFKLVKNLHPSMHFGVLGQTEKLNHRQTWFRRLERPFDSQLGKAIFAVLMGCILASILAYYLQGTEDLRNSGGLVGVETFCTVVFTLELVIRVYVGTMDPWHLCDITLFIDFLSVLPWYLDCWFETDQNIDVEQLGTLAIFLQFLQLLRLLRVLKLLRHYSGWRVLLLAVERSGRAIAVPAFAMLVSILVLSGLHHAFEAISVLELQQKAAAQVPPGGVVRQGNATSLEQLYDLTQSILTADDEPTPLTTPFESFWAVFWLVLTLGYDGNLGAESTGSRIIIAAALLSGILLTTMPITIIGGAFASAWEQKEVVEVAMKVQELLVERGHTAQDVKLVFDAFDHDHDDELDWTEFKAAMRVLRINLPLMKMRRLFLLFDADESGSIDHEEFCRLLFPSVASHILREADASPAPTSTHSRRCNDTDTADGGGNGDSGPQVGSADYPQRDNGTSETSKTFPSPRKKENGSNNWQSALGTLTWHQWHRSTDTRAVMNPMLISTSTETSKAATPRKARVQMGSGASSPRKGKAAFAYAPDPDSHMNLVQLAQQEASKLRMQKLLKPTGGGNHAGTGGATELSPDILQRLNKLEDGMAKVLELLESRHPVKIVGGARFPPAAAAPAAEAPRSAST